MTTLTTVYDTMPAELKSSNGPSKTSPSHRGSPAAKSTPASELPPSITTTTSSPSSLAPGSLSSASSFQSLSSKSSSGICVDSAPDSPDKSYTNADIPDLDDLISACAGITLGPSTSKEDNEEDEADSCDQTFASAADDTLTEDSHAQLLEKALQTLKTPDAGDQTKESSQSSVLPYVSFEESVLRKHQEKSEEFRSALASFQQSVVGTLDNQPSDSPVDKTDGIKHPGFNSPDVSFKEVSRFNESTVLISNSEGSSVFAADLQARLRESSPKSLSILSEEAAKADATQDSLLSTTLGVAREKSVDESGAAGVAGQENVSSTTQDSLVQEKSLNESREKPESVVDVAVQENVLSTTQDAVLDNDLHETVDYVADKAQDILVQENVLSTTQDIVEEDQSGSKQASVLNEAQDIVPEDVECDTRAILKVDDVLNATQGSLKQESIVNKTQDIVREEVECDTQEIFKEKSVLSTTQDIVQEKSLDVSVKQESVLDKAQGVVSDKVECDTQEVLKETNLLNTIQGIVQEKSLDVSVKQESVLDKAQSIVSAECDTQDILKVDSVLSTTQSIVQEKSFDTQDSAKEESILIRTQHTLQEEEKEIQSNIQDIKSTTQDIAVEEKVTDESQETVKQESILNKTNGVLVQEEVQSEYQDIVVQENVLSTTQKVINEHVINENQPQDVVNDKSLSSKAEDIVNQAEDFINQNIVTDTQVVEKKEIIQNKTLDGSNKTPGVVQANVLNEKPNIVVKDDNLNETTSTVVQECFLNRTQDVVKEKNIANQTQDILRENTLNNNVAVIQKTLTINKNQSITQEINDNDIQGDKENRLDNSAFTNEKDDLNETQFIVQRAKQHLIDADALKRTEESVQYNKTQSLNPEPLLQTNKEFKKQESSLLIQETTSPLKGNLIVKNTIKTPDKTELVAEVGKDSEFLPLDKIELVASTPFDKSLNKESVPKETFRRRSALFVESVEDVETELNSTVVIKHPEQVNNQQNVLLTHFQPELEPQKQCLFPLTSQDFDLSEAALSVAKDIDASLEKIEANEGFVSASEVFGDSNAFDFLDQAGTQVAKRGERYDSLFMNFDPLAQRQSMLPQKNLPTAPVAEEEENIVKEANRASPTATANPTPTIPNMDTPKKNPALAAIDRLLFFSPTVTEGSQPVAEAKQKKEVVEKPVVPQVPVVDEKMVKELELVRSTVLQLEAELEKQKKVHKEESVKQKAANEERLASMQAKFTQMQSQLLQEVKCKDQMTVVVEEYEKSISRLIAEREKDKTTFEVEKAKLQEELHVANQHLSNTEAAFSDVHSKYERLKNVVAAYKTNESVLKESITENQETIKTLEHRYEQLKSHAMAQLEKANLELNAIRKHNEAETMKLKALVRKAELKSKSLEETVEQKNKEIKELTGIIDEMIARVD